MKEAGIDKVKYYVMQVDHLLMIELVESDEGAVIVQKVCSILWYDFPNPDLVEVVVKWQGNLKKAENGEDEEGKFLHA